MAKMEVTEFLHDADPKKSQLEKSARKNSELGAP
jgi:hypothetical protein